MIINFIQRRRLFGCFIICKKIMYRKGDRYSVKKGRTYFFFPHPGSPGGKFKQLIGEYANALVNSNGGILVFGVDGKETVQGFHLPRELEDNYKCTFDSVIRQFRPTMHPHQYRLDVLYLNRGYEAIFEVRMSAGDPVEIYENQQKEMFIVRDNRLYGPLFPCEITQIVLQKYKEEISTLLGENATQKHPANSAANSAAEEVAISTLLGENATQKAISTPEIEEQQQLPEAKRAKVEKISWP